MPRSSCSKALCDARSSAKSRGSNGSKPDEASDLSDEDKLVIETPRKSTRRKKVQIPEEDKKLLEALEDELEQSLDEKASKRKLKNCHVKNIIKQVVTNKDVLAYVKHAENPTAEYSSNFEVKITRAKAKELAVKLPFTWKCNINADYDEPSETQVLIHEELPEDDSSEDEYVPAEDAHPDDSDDEQNSSIASEYTPVHTPIQSADCSTQTNWTEDGAFKIPPTRSPIKATSTAENEDANICRRTRSQLCLSDTLLEDIESTFIPPDITTDMYEMDYECDEDWQNFLKGFSRPLEEVAETMPEDDDHDPEYNVLAEEEEVDVEEMRAGKSVAITRKELNDLIGELMDYADNYSNYFAPDDAPDEQIAPPPAAGTQQSREQQIVAPLNATFVVLNYSVPLMGADQKALFEQQMRQHVQLLTQGFLLTHKHPELDGISPKYKSYLEDLKETATGTSFLECTNITGALELATAWEEKLNCDTPVIKKFNEQVAKTCYEAKQAKLSGRFYVPKFPDLMLETVVKGKVFVYPSLLPRIACTERDPRIVGYCSSENELIALGLQQFEPFLKADAHHLKRNGDLRVKDVCYYIKKYMLPSKDLERLYKHVLAFRCHDEHNPIKLYHEQGIVMPTLHYVVPLSEYQNIPPCKRNPNELPHQWREYVYPETANADVPFPQSSQPIIKVSKPPAFNKKFVRKRQRSAKTKSAHAKDDVQVKQPQNESLFFPHDVCVSTPKCKKSLFKLATPGVRTNIEIPESLLRVKFNSSIFKHTFLKSLDSEEATMEDIDELPVAAEVVHSLNDVIVEVIDVSSSTIDNGDKDAECIIVDGTVDELTMHDNGGSVEQKDNLDDINALVVASSTIKSAAKRRPTGSEKKRAKMKRDFAHNLRLLTEEEPDIIQEKRDRFIQAFYDKVQDTLAMEDFHKFMCALNEYDEQATSPTALYNSVAEILDNKHPEILDEFLLFFDSLQAKSLGKLVPYLMLSNMSLFLRKLEVFFHDQPSQVRKIYRAITDLSARSDVTMAEVKSTVLPLLKGNGLLNDWFLQIFPTERPPSRLLEGAWETVCLSKDADDDYENVVLPEGDDAYGGSSCVCSCHASEDDGFKARSQHCTPCGIKYLQGRVFFQTGKGLRPAKITFDDKSVDHQTRLSASLKKRSESSPSKVISPGKDSQDEARASSDEEPDKKRALKPATKRKPRKKAEKRSLAAEAIAIDASPRREDDAADRHGAVDVVDVTPMLMADEAREWDCGALIDSNEGRQSPEAGQSADSESECCEEFETSQDNASDSDISGNDGEAPSLASDEHPWTREEDKIILETFQKEEVMDNAYSFILEQLTGRTLEQVKDRFDVLINFLKKIRDTR